MTYSTVLRITHDIVRNGEEAIELTAVLQPDVIKIELRMLGVNGIEVSQRIHTVSPALGFLWLPTEKWRFVANNYSSRANSR